MRIKMYSVPESIAADLGLTGLRSTDGSGNYLLSSQDIRAYGFARAIADGATGLTVEEAKEKFNL